MSIARTMHCKIIHTYKKVARDLIFGIFDIDHLRLGFIHPTEFASGERGMFVGIWHVIVSGLEGINGGLGGFRCRKFCNSSTSSLAILPWAASEIIRKSQVFVDRSR